jgi:23S rRNA pseudouridine2605 synthase
MIRINKFLARCKLGSRRKVEEFILNGEVNINGEISRNLSCMINPASDVVKYKGKVLTLNQDKIYLMLNKPLNYLVSSRDDFGRKLVYELLPDFNTHLFSIGRLDYNSEGLLLFTNDGDFAQKIIHPRFKLPKLYKVSVKGRILNEQVEKLRNGVMIETGKTQPALVFIKQRDEKKSVLKITIYEGQKRQIRYMMKAVGTEALELKRLQIGNLKLGKLPSGMWRFLKPNEYMDLVNFTKNRR